MIRKVSLALLCLQCLLCLFCLSGCREGAAHQVTPAIYYWKTVYAPGAYEQARWKEAGCSRVYVRCFDVVTERGGAPRPAGIIRNLGSADRALRYVPVVFITTDVLRQLAGADCRPLAANICGLLATLFEGLPGPDELQVDCDWTASTRETYFRLLSALRAEPFAKGKTLSCTIRPHQVKYRLRSGIPPVDRGLLMCYNMGNMKQPGAHNSILDISLAKDYLGGLRQYPLPLDAALPLFRWCLQFRDGKLRGILRDIDTDLVQQTALFRATGKSLYTCKSDTVWMGYPFEAGDVVRTEIPAPEDIRVLAAFTAARIRNDSLRVILFHSDSLTLAKYPPDEIEAIYGAYR